MVLKISRIEMLAKNVLFNIFLYSFTALTSHFLISLGRTLFHRYLGHRRIGGKFAADHIHFHHGFYSDDHVASENYLDQERNNTPFFLIPVVIVVSLSCLFMPFDLLIIQLTAMSISFYAHDYIDRQYHVTTSWLGRYSWFRRRQQLHFVHHRHANYNFAVIDYFWDRLLGTYRSSEPPGQTAPTVRSVPKGKR
jgi:sterol desaturase/sphingolipid hydroxylase (fatty acid hydroxylase superfamily)